MNKTPQLLKDWIVERTIELNQPVYIKDILTSEWKMCYAGRRVMSVSRGKEKLWVPFKLIKMRHVKGRPPEYLGYGEGKGD